MLLATFYRIKVVTTTKTLSQILNDEEKLR